MGARHFSSSDIVSAVALVVSSYFPALSYTRCLPLAGWKRSHLACCFVGMLSSFIWPSLIENPLPIPGLFSEYALLYLTSSADGIPFPHSQPAILLSMLFVHAYVAGEFHSPPPPA